MNEYLLLNLRLVDPEKGRTQEGQMVHVRGDRAAAAGRNLKVAKGVRRIDLGGRVVMPGLIDCYVHIMSIKTKWQTIRLCTCFRPTPMQRPQSKRANS